MRVIRRKRLREFWASHPNSRTPLTYWYRLTAASSWRNHSEVRATFGSVDTAKVASGNTVTIFDIEGNDFRLIAALHFNTGIVYVLKILTHGEYDGETWKDAP